VLQRLIDWTTTDWALKLTALALAFLLWTTVRADAPGQWQTDIAVRVINNDADWIMAEPPVPAEVRVTIRGPYRELLRTASDRPDIIVPVDQVRDSTEMRRLREDLVRLPPGTAQTRVTMIHPDMVRLTFDRVATRLIPVAIRLAGEPPPGFELAGRPDLEPSIVRASGAARSLARIDSLYLPPIDLAALRGRDTLKLTIDTTGLGIIISPRTVRVVVPLEPAADVPAAAQAQQPRGRLPGS
jgi:YbbR domain-containing protein